MAWIAMNATFIRMVERLAGFLLCIPARKSLQGRASGFLASSAQARPRRGTPQPQSIADAPHHGVGSAGSQIPAGRAGTLPPAARQPAHHGLSPAKRELMTVLSGGGGRPGVARGCGPFHKSHHIPRCRSGPFGLLRDRLANLLNDALK
jgi:hypothetical protein